MIAAIGMTHLHHMPLPVELGGILMRAGVL
jgi:hypothetical protein